MYNVDMKESRRQKRGDSALKSSLIFRAVIMTLCSVLLVVCLLFVISIYANSNKADLAEAEDRTSLSTQPTIEATNIPDAQTPTPQISAPDDTPQPTDEIVVSEYYTIVLGDENTSVANLQVRLMELGYMDYDEPSSTFNYATQSAVMLFQRAQDMEMTGIADSTLQELIFSDQAPAYQVKISDSGADIRSLQYRLNELGYYDAKISGYFGPNTEASVLSFQMQNGLLANGVVSYEDWQLLYSSDALASVRYEEVTPSPTPTKAPRTPKPSSNSGASTPKPSNTGSGSSPTSTPKPTSSTTGGGSSSYSHSPSGIIECAKDQMGKSYVWGDEGPNTFDCSGLVYFCLKSCGVSTSRVNARSFSQKSSWELVSSIDDLREGDLVFFKSDTSDGVNHTGIYIGGGRFIHASSSKGEVVRSSFSSDSTQYWNRNFVCGRRVFG